jgi:hypothetical protein
MNEHLQFFYRWFWLSLAITIEISRTGLAVFFEDWLRPEKIEANLLRLIEIRKLLPDYLFTKN